MIVTGAARGMGAEIAREAARQGARVVAVDRVAGAWQDLVRGIGGMAIESDLTKSGNPEAVVEAAIKRYGRLDVLVNNAGMLRVAPMLETSEADVDAILNVNVKAAFFMTQSAVSAMIKLGGGSIVNIASIAGTAANPGNAIYGISKAAMISLTWQTAVEFGPQGIRCNSVSPGMTNWGMVGTNFTDQMKEGRAKLVPARRLATPEDIAGAVMFFASDVSQYVSGESLLVDGALSKSLLGLIPVMSAAGGTQ